MNVPGVKVDLPALTQKDMMILQKELKEDLII